MTTEQIIRLYEDDNISVEELAEAFPELNIEAIKIALANGSSKYRKAVVKDSQMFGEDTFEAAKTVMASLIYAEEPTIKYRAAKFILNENKGRHDLKDMKSNNLFGNVNLINIHLEKARKRIAESEVEDSKTQEVVEV